MQFFPPKSLWKNPRAAGREFLLLVWPSLRGQAGDPNVNAADPQHRGVDGSGRRRAPCVAVAIRRALIVKRPTAPPRRPFRTQAIGLVTQRVRQRLLDLRPYGVSFSGGTAMASCIVRNSSAFCESPQASYRSIRRWTVFRTSGCLAPN